MTFVCDCRRGCIYTPDGTVGEPCRESDECLYHGEDRAERMDPIGCGAEHGGCGCMGSWDCAHDNKLQRVTDTIARLAHESGSPYVDPREWAVEVLRAVFPKERRDR